MATEWFYTKDDEKIGPVSTSDLKSLAETGQLTADDFVWKEGLADWKPASSIKGLFSSPTATPAPPPPLPKLSVVEPQSTSAAVIPPTEQATKAMRSMFGTLKGAVGGALGSLQGSPKSTSSATSTDSSLESKEDVDDEDAAEVEPPPRLPENVAQADVLAQCEVTYRGGHPQQTDDGDGILYLATNGVYFIADNPAHDIAVPYSEIIEVLTPVLGSYSKQMIAKGKTAKNLAKVGTNLTRLAGGFLGGMEGRAVRAIGATATGAAADQSNLGPLPKNRLAVITVEGAVKHKVVFDVMAPKKDEMEQQADLFWRRVASVRSKFFNPAARPQPAAPIPMLPTGTTQESGPGVTPQQGMTGQGFYISRSGVVSGPYSETTIRQMIQQGSLGPNDTVRIEVWLPVAMFGLLGMSISPMAGGGAVTNSAVGIADQVAAPNSRRSMVPTIAAAAGGLAAGVAVASLLSPKTAQAATRGMRRQPVHSNPGHGVPIDTDGDGVPDAVGFDNDHDGRFDAIGIDTDHDGKIDALGIDRDQDGHIEVMGRDTDHDGHLDTFGFDTDHDGEIDAVAHDYDGDGDFDDYSDA